MVVEFLHIEGAVDVESSVVGDGVAKCGAVFQLRTPHPGVIGVVGDIRSHPVEDGDEVERHVVGGLEVLGIVKGCSKVPDGRPYGVFPCGVMVGIEVFVDGCVWLLNLSVCAAGEVQMQVLGEVPPDGEVPVPEELLAE